MVLSLRMSPIVSYMYMHWLMNSLGRIRKGDLCGGGVACVEEAWPGWRRCGFVGRSMLLGVGFAVLEAHARPSVYFSVCCMQIRI